MKDRALQDRVETLMRKLPRTHPQRKLYAMGLPCPAYQAVDSGLQAAYLVAVCGPDHAVYNWARSAASYALETTSPKMVRKPRN